MHDRGVLSSTLIENGVMIRPVGLGILEQQFSRAGRRGDMSKKRMTKTIKDTHVSSGELKDMILGECLPSYCEISCESFVRWDRHERDRRTASGKAAPAIESQQVGNIVLYRRESRAVKHELRRNSRPRLTGFKNRNSLSEAQLRDSKFARTFLDFSHPCLSIDLLVFHKTQTKDFTSLETEAQTQRGFNDEHGAHHRPTPLHLFGTLAQGPRRTPTSKHEASTPPPFTIKNYSPLSVPSTRVLSHMKHMTKTSTQANTDRPSADTESTIRQSDCSNSSTSQTVGQPNSRT